MQTSGAKMGKFIDLQKTMDKLQGPSARTLDRLPAPLQNSLAKKLGYHHDFKELNPFLKCLLAAQKLQHRNHLILPDYETSRNMFREQMQGILATSTPIKKVQELKLPLARQTLNARLYHPNPNKKLPLIIFYHGGGFVIGDLETHDEACRLLAKHANAQVLSIDYPLAPEHSPEHIVGCCVEALEWVYNNSKQLRIEKNRIAVAGDSAGGNLSAVVSQKTQHTVYAPNAQFLIYPAVDFKSRYASYYKYRDGLILNDRDIDLVTAFYVTTHNVDLDHPIVSPIYGELDKVAPAFILSAKYDLLYDEGQIYTAKLKQAGVKVASLEAHDQTHGFINFTPIHKAAKLHWIHAAKEFRKFWNKLK